jgi:molybdate transport system ATP-binding protein
VVAAGVSLKAWIGLRRGELELDATVTIGEHELVVLLGPNGAGKSTLLRALAGLVPLEWGSVELDGRLLEDPGKGIRVPTERRPVGLVFQDHLLFGHLSVLENVAFGLRAKGASKQEARRQARSWLEALSLAERAEAKPRALSGGQAQRVALARALATTPRLLLLDEPLAALDAGARPQVRRELRRHLASFAGSRLLVTHDPVEAMLLADRIVVLESGRVVQTGSLGDLRERPRSDYVAGLVGLNLFRGRADGDRVRLDSGVELVAPAAGRGEVMATVHPRAVALYRSRPAGSPRNVWAGRVTALDLEGDRVRVAVSGPAPIVAEITPSALAELALAEGEEVWVSMKATEITVYPA